MRGFCRVHLSIPSVAFAEANWYGSLRGGIESAEGDTRFFDGASRWGIKGQSEVSEGLTAVYQFEHNISTTDASQSGGRLAYVGLSGSYGSLTFGQIWSASYNHAGVIRDFPNWYTSSDTTLRVGNALSYSLSTGAFSMQIDAIMDKNIDTGQAVDQLEFGMTIGLGEIGKLALGYTQYEDIFAEAPVVMTPAMEAVAPIPAMHTYTDQDGKTTMVEEISVTVSRSNANYFDEDELVLLGPALPAIALDAQGYFTDSRCEEVDQTEGDECIDVKAYALRTIQRFSNAGSDVVQVQNKEEYHLDSEVVSTDPVPGKDAVDEVVELQTQLVASGRKESHISAEFGLGSVTAALGYSEKEINGVLGEEKTSFIGAQGGIGDSGLNWGAFSRKVKHADNSEKDSWTIGLNKNLGGGATAYIEHNDDGTNGNTVIALRVDF